MQDFEALYRLNMKVNYEFERLLKEAGPTPLRLHQLVKTFQAETSKLTYDEIESRLRAIYVLRYDERTGGVVARSFGIRPYPWLTGQLLLNFSNAVVSETKKYTTACTITHLLRSTLDLPSAIVDTALLHQVIHLITKPRVDQKKAGIDFQDFIERWQHVCAKRFGDVYEAAFEELQDLLTQIEFMTFEIQTRSHILTDQEMNRLEVSQTDLDWMKAILQHISTGRILPLHPLSRGPKSPTLVRVETLVRTLRLIPPSKHDDIKATVSRTCSTLLKAYGQAA